MPPADSETAFTTHHLWGYTRQPDGGTLEYEVEHPRWAVWPADAPVLDADVADLYGAALVPVLARPPVSTLVAEGSPVTVFRPRRLPAEPRATDVSRAPSSGRGRGRCGT